MSCSNSNPLDAYEVDAPLSRVLSKLDLDHQSILRKLVARIGVPFDSAWTGRVVFICWWLIDAFKQSIILPSPPLVNLTAELKDLADEITRLGFFDATVSISMAGRSLKLHAPWRLLVLIPLSGVPKPVLEALGAELSLCVHKPKRFRGAFAGKVLEYLKQDFSVGNTELSSNLSGLCVYIHECARKVFSNSQAVIREPTDQVRDELTRFFANELMFARDQHRQATLDRRCLTRNQISRSAKKIAEQVNLAEPRAVVEMTASVLGVSPRLVEMMPILDRSVEDWVLGICIEEGASKLDLDVIAPDAAKPPKSGVIPANRILVRPIPKLLHQVISRQDELTDKTAKTFGELFTVSTTMHSVCIFPEEKGRHGIATTYARFRNSIGQFGVQNGLTRSESALVTARIFLIPKSKLYYLNINRESIWQAATYLYESLGWGPAVPLVSGLTTGCQVVPTVETIVTWYGWIRDQVKTAYPGRNCSLPKLINFHNVYTHFVVSIYILVFGLRERDPYPIFSNRFRPYTSEGSLLDKASGKFAGPSDLPLCEVARLQTDYCYFHCHAMIRRLLKLGVPSDNQFIRHLQAVLAGKETHLLVTATEQLLPVPIGCGSVKTWWPDELGMVGNFGRGTLQTYLPQTGSVTTREIDAYVRHHLPGLSPASTTSDIVNILWSDRINAALDTLLDNWGVHALPGLVRRPQ